MGGGSGTVDASILGLIGFAPDTTCPDKAAAALERVRTHGRLMLGGRQDIAFDPATDIDLAGHVIPDLHPNGMQLAAFDADGAPLSRRTYYSTGGGFVASEAQLRRKPKDDRINTGTRVPHDFGSAEELLAECARTDLSIAELILACARDGRVERSRPAMSRVMATAGYLLPALPRMLHPLLAAKGRRAKDRYRRKA